MRFGEGGVPLKDRLRSHPGAVSPLLAAELLIGKLLQEGKPCLRM